MMREDITRQFPDAAKEQIDAIMAIHGEDVNRAKGDAATLQKDLETARATIKTLEESKGDTAALQKKLDEYEQAEKDRKAAEAAAAERAALSGRMAAAMGERKFAHEKLHGVVLDDFAAALKAKENIGKSDKDVFEELTKDQNYFASQNPPAKNMGGFGNLPGDNDDAALRRAFGLPEKK